MSGPLQTNPCVRDVQADAIAQNVAWENAPVCPNSWIPNQTGKVFIITGGTTINGRETTRLLIEKNAKVYVVGPSRDDIDLVVQMMYTRYPYANIDGLELRFSDLSTIKPAVDYFLGRETRLDGILHNAGVLKRDEIFDLYGYGNSPVINAIGEHLIQKLLDPILIKTAEVSPRNSIRVVWGEYSAPLRAPEESKYIWADPHHPYRYESFGKYGREPTALHIYQSQVWADKNGDTGIVCVSTDSGWLKNDQMYEGHCENLSFAGCMSYTACFQMWALMNPQLKMGASGAYYGLRGTRPDTTSRMLERIERRAEYFWGLLEQCTGQFGPKKR